MESESEERNGWLVEPDDEASLVQALVEAVTDAGERRLRGENGLRLVREEYSWRAAAERVSAIYEEVTEDVPTVG